jgi:FkbM family methyltransferase
MSPAFLRSRPAIIEKINLLRHRILRTFEHTSYAQEGEDIILRRIFESQRQGFYVDIGAHHPQRFSNTYLFYLMKWSGINIDAMPGSMHLFNYLRPRDINLELAVGDADSSNTFFIFNDRALNTFDPDHAREYVAHGYKIVAQIPIAMKALRDILHEHVPPGRTIDFLSVDVEGLDLEVLRSNDWARFRPTYVLVETLHADLDALATSPVAMFLHGHAYKLYAKTPNTAFFRCQQPHPR